MEDQATKVKVLIVEDVAITALDISNGLTDSGYHIVGIASTAQQAQHLLLENPNTDVVLIDIVLKGSHDGIELARIINEKYHLPFVFLTSHADTHLVERAKGVRPFGYILKPFNARQVGLAIEFALVNFSNKTHATDLLTPQNFSASDNQVLQIKDSLFLKKDHHFERVPLKEILFLKADSNYSTVFTKTKQFVYSTVLKKIESQLPVGRFLRIHRSYVVNIELVNGFEGNMLFIGSKKLPVSKAHRNQVFRLFRTI